MNYNKYLKYKEKYLNLRNNLYKKKITDEREISMSGGGKTLDSLVKQYRVLLQQINEQEAVMLQLKSNVDKHAKRYEEILEEHERQVARDEELLENQERRIEIFADKKIELLGRIDELYKNPRIDESFVRPEKVHSLKIGNYVLEISLLSGIPVELPIKVYPKTIFAIDVFDLSTGEYIKRKFNTSDIQFHPDKILTQTILSLFRIFTIKIDPGYSNQSLVYRGTIHMSKLKHATKDYELGEERFEERHDITFSEKIYEPSYNSNFCTFQVNCQDDILVIENISSIKEDISLIYFIYECDRSSFDVKR